MDKVLKFYKLVNGVEMPFPSGDEQIVTSDFTYTAQRMGGAPTITCTVMHHQALDDEFNDDVYVRFNGEKYHLRRKPTASFGNSDVRNKYDIEFVSERVILDNVYFFDVVNDPTYKGASNSTEFTFSGDIHEFAKRLGYSLTYSNIDYTVVVDEGVTSEMKNVSFSNQFFSNVLQEIYNTYQIPYYFEGKAIHIGAEPKDSLIQEVFEYGCDNALLSITKQSANNKIVNRITGVGSDKNLPYYYPNETPLGDVSILLDKANSGLKTEYFEITNPELVNSRVGLNTKVEYTKYTPNELQSVTVAYSLNGGWATSHFTNGCYSTSGYDYLTKGTRREVYYHIKFLGSLKQSEAGVLRLEWRMDSGDRNPYNWKKKNGSLNWATFDGLEAYEIISGEQKQIKFDKRGDATILIDLPFNGYDDQDGKRNFEIHLKFVHFSDTSSTKKKFEGFDQNRFYAVDLVKQGEVAYTWRSSRYSSSDIKKFGIRLTEDGQDYFDKNKDACIGASISLKQEGYVTPSSNLLPAICRATEWKQRFYGALNNTYKNSLGEYIKFANLYNGSNPSEHVENFDDIKPSINGIVNSSKQPFNKFLDIAYDLEDNDTVDDDGNLVHPYFYVKLPKYDGDFSFNLFDCLNEKGEMSFSMTSGHCGACTFKVAVDEETLQNTVQVDENGNLQRTEEGRVALGNAQTEQNDTRNNEVWLALFKDKDTFPSIMPNNGESNKPSTEDTFVILDITLPHSYITAAEKRLEDALIDYMANNNDHKFNFSISLSRIFFAEHPEILQRLSENSSVRITYHGKEFTLFVSSFVYDMSSNDILPEINIELKDTLSVSSTALDNIVNAIKLDVSEAISNINIERAASRAFVRKDVDDIVNGYLRFNKGFESIDDASFGKFKEDTKGAGIYQDESGKWHIEADYLKARNKIVAKSVEIEEAHHIGGQQMLTSASARIDYVVEREDVYRCYFLKRDTSGDTIYNKWMVGDQAYCKYFNVENTPTDNTSGIIQKYYWRLVVATSNDTTDDNITLDIDGNTIITSEYHFIDLSKTQCDGQSDVPQTQDNIVQLGHQGKDKDRQNAIVMAGAGDGSPYIRQYVGINSFSLPEADTQIKPNDNVFTGKMVIKSGSTGLSGFNEWEGVEKDINDAKQNAQYAKEQIDDAVGTANKAQEDASLALTNSTDAKVLAESANDLADAAKNLADTANNVASNAFGAVEELDEIAREAKETAELASQVSGEAKSQAEQAQSAAQSAKDTADSAKDTLTSWSADNVISPLEKQGVKDEYAWVVNDTNDIQEQVNKYALNDTDQHQNYLAAQEAYALDLSSIIHSTDDVVAIPEEMNTHQTEFYTTRTAILSLIAESAKKIADDAQTAADNAKTAADNAKKTADEAKQQAAGIKALVDTLDENVLNINKRLDGVVENYFVVGVPTTDNYPANEWVTENDKANHVGDTYTNIQEYVDDETTPDAGKSWRWVPIDDAHTDYYWHPIADSDAVKALQEASKAQSTADGKSTTFLSKPTSYKQGDLWILDNTTVFDPYQRGDILTAIKNNTQFDSKDWRKVIRYTDDSALDTFLNGEYSEFVSNIKSQVDGKAQTWYQDDDPSKNWSDEEKEQHIGDLWYDISTKKNYVYGEGTNGYGWQEIDGVPNEVYDTIDGKSSIFFTDSADVLPDTPYYKRDLWSIGNRGQLKICIKDNESEKGLLSDWVNADDTIERIDGITTGAGNLIRNSGFTGDYVTTELKDGTSLSEAFEMYNPSLQHWDGSKGATALESTIASQSGKMVQIVSNGWLQQKLTHYVSPNEDYALSFFGKGGKVDFTFAGVAHPFTLTSEPKRYTLKLKSKSNDNLIMFAVSGTTTYLSDIMLEKGNVISSWSMSPMDNISAMAEYEKTTYLQQLLKIDTTFNEGESTLRTGVINTGLIQMGNLDDEGKLAETTAGMSGIYNGGDSVAFFGGGTWEDAMATVDWFNDNPNKQPTEAQLASMAKAVITHGGRAFLQDIILRGLVYAEGGVFRGTVYANDGEFKGKVEATDGEFHGTVYADDGVFNGLLKGSSEYGSVQMGISNDTAENKKTILSITSPVLYENGEPVTEAGYATTFSWIQDNFMGIGYTTLNMELSHLNAKHSAWYSQWNGVTGDEQQPIYTQIEAGGLRIKDESGKGITASQNFFTVNNAEVQLHTSNILLDIDKLPTNKDGLLKGQLYRDGDTLKIKTQ